MQGKGLNKLGDVLWSCGQKTVLHCEDDLPSIPAKVERLFVCIRYDDGCMIKTTPNNKHD